LELTQKAIDALENVAQDRSLREVLGQLPGAVSSAIDSGVDASGIDEASNSGRSLSKSLTDAGFTFMGGAADFAGAMATGNATISSGAKIFTDTLGSAIPALRGLGERGIAVIKYFEGSIDTLETLTASGASFNNSIIQMNYAASQSRLTLDEFAGMVSKNSEQLVALGGSVTKGAQTFSNMSRDFFDNGLGNDLINMGMSFEEVNESLMNYAEINRRSIAEGAITDAQAQQSAAKMAKEMDLVAKLTGKNRKELEAEIQDRMRKGQVQAKIRLLEMEGNHQAAEEFRRALAEAKKAGPDAEAALEEMFTKGTVVSEAGRRGLVALGDAGAELTNVVTAINDPARDVGPALDQFNAAIVERINSREFLQGAALGGMGGVVDGMATVLENAGPYADAVSSSQQGAIDENTSRQEILRRVNEMKESAIAEQDARDGMTRTMQMADARMKDSYAAIGNQLYGADGVLQQLSNSNFMATAGDTLEFGMNRESIEALLSGLRDLVPGAGNDSGTDINLPSPSSVEVTPEQQENIQAIQSDIAAAVENGAITGANETANIINNLLAGPWAADALRLLEEVSNTTTAQEEAAKAIEENNVAFAEELRNILREQNTQRVLDENGVDNSNRDAATGVLDVVAGRQNTGDAVADGQFRVDNFTVANGVDIGFQPIVQQVETIASQNQQAQTQFTESMNTVNTALQPIPGALSDNASATTTGLEGIRNTLSTSIDALTGRINELIEAQNRQTNTIRRSDTNLQ
jgi:hypothetical protein